jgi:hypothetical protein
MKHLHLGNLHQFILLSDNNFQINIWKRNFIFRDNLHCTNVPGKGIYLVQEEERKGERNKNLSSVAVFWEMYWVF